MRLSNLIRILRKSVTDPNAESLICESWRWWATYNREIAFRFIDGSRTAGSLTPRHRYASTAVTVELPLRGSPKENNHPCPVSPRRLISRYRRRTEANRRTEIIRNFDDKPVAGSPLPNFYSHPPSRYEIQIEHLSIYIYIRIQIYLYVEDEEESCSP